MSDRDEVPRVWFENDGFVERVCPKCQKFLKAETVRLLVNGLDEARSEAECKTCGPVSPEYGWL